MWWASVVLMTAYCSIPSQEETAEKAQDAQAKASGHTEQHADYKKAEQASKALRQLLGS